MRCRDVAPGPEPDVKASEREYRIRLETGKRLDRRIEGDATGYGLAIAEVEACDAGIPPALDDHEPPPILQLREERVRTPFDSTFDDDDIVGCFGRISVGQSAFDDDRVVASQCRKPL